MQIEIDIQVDAADFMQTLDIIQSLRQGNRQLQNLCGKLQNDTCATGNADQQRAGDQGCVRSTSGRISPAHCSYDLAPSPLTVLISSRDRIRPFFSRSATKPAAVFLFRPQTFLERFPNARAATENTETIEPTRAAVLRPRSRRHLSSTRIPEPLTPTLLRASSHSPSARRIEMKNSVKQCSSGCASHCTSVGYHGGT